MIVVWTSCFLAGVMVLGVSANPDLCPYPICTPTAPPPATVARIDPTSTPTADPPSAPVLSRLSASDAPETLEELQRASVSPTPRPTAAPRAKPKPTTTPKPKLAGGPYKPWREFGANVTAARVYAKSVLSSTSWRCLDVLFDRESRWRTHAGNRRSGAYGIPQALPGSKMAWAGDDWRDNATTQVRWGIHYIKGRYGNACVALDHSYRWGWY